MAEFKGPKAHEKIYRLIEKHVGAGHEAFGKGKDAKALEHFMDATRKFNILFTAGESQFKFDEAGFEHLDNVFDSFGDVMVNLNNLARDGSGKIKLTEGFGPKNKVKKVPHSVSKVAEEWHDKCFNAGVDFINRALEKDEYNADLWELKCNVYNNVLAQLVINKSKRANKIYSQGLRTCNQAVDAVPDDVYYFLNTRLELHDEMANRAFSANNFKQVDVKDVEDLDDDMFESIEDVE
ncbi:MAG: hypothetical protein GOV15_03580, partial [Candidatus Diapherotrites archaeon]|nr:hypothetical protein [Candidatus Diapherotrites archaeon]